MTANAKNNGKIFEASILGTMAFNNGLKRIPCIDEKLMNLIDSNEIGDSIPFMKAWTKSWDNANLSK